MKTKKSRTSGLDALRRANKDKLNPLEINNLLLPCYTAISVMDSLPPPQSEVHWTSLAASLNLALIFCKLNIHQQGLSAIDNALNALERIKQHGQQSNNWRIGIHMFAISCAMEIYSTQLREVTKGQFLQAYEEVFKQKGN